jgi:hypothetical protein
MWIPSQFTATVCASIIPHACPLPARRQSVFHAAAVLLLNLTTLFLVFAPASAENLYWTDISQAGIHRANLDGSDVQQLVEAEARALAVDPSSDTMYWNEMFGLMRSNLDGTDIELIQRTSGFSAFVDIALDVDAAKIYLAHGSDHPGGSLERMNPDGTGLEYLVFAVRDIGAIAVDPGSDTLCWGDDGQIMCTNLDATEELVVVTDAYARGMALDGAGKIYWIERDRIRRANVDGSNAEDLVTGLAGEGRDIALDPRAGELYWLAGGLLRRSNLDGSDIVELVTGLVSPFRIALDLIPALLQLPIDIQRGGVSNSLNPLSRGVIPVAILGSEEFDVTRLDPETLGFGPAGAAPAHRGDGHFANVNGDGYLDFMSHYRVGETGLVPGDMEACVTGETLDGAPFEGCDTVEVFVPPSGLH